MANINDIKEMYLAIGVGGISFVMLVYVLWYYITKITPLLNQIKQEGAVTQSIIVNNTKALEEMSKSNQNVATALTILDKSMSNVHTDVKKVVDVNDSIEKMLLVMDERLK